MLFNCTNCAKTISSKTINCPYCEHNVAKVGVQIERAKLKENATELFKELRGSVTRIRLGLNKHKA